MAEILVVEADERPRLDVYLTGELPQTRSRIKKLIDGGFITVNGKREKGGKTLKPGDIVEIETCEEENSSALPEDIPIEIIYQDEDLAVVNKPQGMTVHPAPGNYTHTLVNALLFKFGELSGVGGTVRPGIVHRLDKDTSGVMVVAKNDKAHLSLSEQIAARTVRKEYIALLEGNLSADSGRIDTLIGRNERDRKLMCVREFDGRRAVTDYSVEERFKENCLVRFLLHTGRTHQIRVHCKFLGHPIVGDKSYGLKKQRFELNGQLLHSTSLTFVHPSTGEEMTFIAPLPEYFTAVLDKIRRSERKLL